MFCLKKTTSNQEGEKEEERGKREMTSKASLSIFMSFRVSLFEVLFSVRERERERERETRGKK